MTSSEAYLSTLARRAFLQLWAYRSPFIQRGGAKELSDLIVVFGNDVVVFSDKECRLEQNDNLRLTWSRWYRRAVESSASQVWGAERAILRKEPLFQDPACRQRLSLTLPTAPRIHRILTVRGAADAAHAEWGGRGSLVITNRSLSACREAPFRLGATDNGGRFYHVFDQNALDAILINLDTVTDFLGYLVKRRAYLSQPRAITASSEEDLLGLYLLSFDESLEHQFPSEPAGPTVVDGSHWQRWMASEQRAARDVANQDSYGWDALVEKFAHHTIRGTSEYATSNDISEQEPLLRWLARVPRFKRRVLIRMIFEMVETTPPGRVRRRLLASTTPGDPFWVFLIMPKPPFAPYERYRAVRRLLLEDHVFVAKYLHPDASDIVGLAVGESDGVMTEDALAVDCSDWPPEFFERGKRHHEKDGIFARATPVSGTDYEYPV